jgi:hypothetical protein
MPVKYFRAQPSHSTCSRRRADGPVAASRDAIEETSVTKIISRRAMLMAVVAACSLSFAASPVYLPRTQQLVGPGGETHHADGIRGRSTAMPQRLLHQDPFADLLLG